MNSSDTFIAPEDATADIQKAHYAGPTMFQGKELWSFTRATRFYFQQAYGPADLVNFRDLAFCYVHLKRGGKTVKEDVLSIMPVLMDSALLRVVLGDWLEELSGGGFEKADAIIEEAGRIRDAAYKLAEKTKVDASDPDPVTGLKPLEAPVPMTTAISAISSPLNTATPSTSPAGSGPSGSNMLPTTPSLSPAVNSVTEPPP